MNSLRHPEPGRHGLDRRGLHPAFVALLQEVESYLTALVRTHLASSGSERLTNVHNRHGVIGLLEDGLNQLVVGVRGDAAVAGAGAAGAAT